jgi:phasin family protein
MSDEITKTVPDAVVEAAKAKAPVPATSKPKPVTGAVSAPKPAVKAEAVKPTPAAPTPVVKAVKAAAQLVLKAKPVAAKPAVAKLAVKRPVKPVKTPLTTTAKKSATPAQARARAAATNKGTTAMTETITKFASEATERGQALFGDMNARAKAALEKSTKLVEELNEFNKGNIEAVVESTKVAAKGAEALGQQAAESARKNFEKTSAALKSFASVKSPTELFQLQSEFARSSFDSFVSESSKNTEAFLKLAGDMFQPLSNRIAVAAEKIKTAA